MKKEIKLILFFFLYLQIGLFAQSSPVILASFKAEATVPHPSTNLAFRKSFVGVYDLTAAANIGIGGGISIGGIFKLHKFKVPANKIQSVNSLQTGYGTGARVSYDKFIAERIILSFAINGGYEWMEYSKLKCTNGLTDFKFTSSFIEPTANLYFYADDNFAIGLNLSYNIHRFTFDPYAVCFNEKETYKPDDLKGNTASFNLGFGLTYMIFKKGTAPANISTPLPEEDE